MLLKRWLLPLFVGLIMFGNHYVRDSLGALEKQFELNLNYTPQEYANLNAFYFFPNIITPLLAGMILDKIGVYTSFLYAVIIASIGHLCFALGVTLHSKLLVYFSRALSGSMYEIIDALLPITYLGPLFQSEFQIVVGFMQVFIRLGSVVNFIVSPILYHLYGLNTAFWVAALVGSSSIILILCAKSIEQEYVEYLKLHPDITNQKDQKDQKDQKNQNKTRNRNRDRDRDNNKGEDDDEDDKEVELTVYDDETTSLVTQDQLKSDIETNVNNSNQDSSSSSSFSSLINYLVLLLPLHKLPFQYYLWLLSGSLTYGSIVPFWFVGSKYIQNYYFKTVLYADTLMTIPEGMVVLLGFPLAYISKKFQWNVKQKLYGLAIAQFGMCFSFILLMSSSFLLLFLNYNQSNDNVDNVDNVDNNNNNNNNNTLNTNNITSSNNDSELIQNSELSEYTSQLNSLISFLILQIIPIVSLTILGISFSFSCSFFWGSTTDIVSSSSPYFSQSSGIVSSGVNILPTIILPVVSWFIIQYHMSEGFPMNLLESTSPITLFDILFTAENITILLLGILAFFGTICSIFAAYYVGKLD